MKKITALTSEQEGRFGEFVDKWLKIGLSTDPVNLEPAKKAAIAAYENVGLPAPTNFYTARSPIEAIDLIQKLAPEKKRSEIFSEMFYGNQDASWFSFYDFFLNAIGIEECAKLNPIFELALHTGWVSMYEDVVVFQDRPDTIKFDDRNLLHCEDGPAIHYRDGYSIYAWHGVRIPAEWIEKKHELSPTVALTWENIEQRRCACEILGWARILRELDSTVIDSDVDPQIGDLLEVAIPDIGREKFLQVVCGTGRTFAIPVPPEMKTALEANAWTYGIEPDLLKQIEFRT